MSPRLGIVAQAIGVIALGSIIYVAFLSPEDPDPLTGIEVEDGVNITPPRILGTGGRREGVPEQRNGPRPRRSATLPRLVATTPPSFEPVAVEPIDTPSGSQYADGVARILSRVAGTRP